MFRHMELTVEERMVNTTLLSILYSFGSYGTAQSYGAKHYDNITVAQQRNEKSYDSRQAGKVY